MLGLTGLVPDLGYMWCSYENLTAHGVGSSPAVLSWHWHDTVAISYLLHCLTEQGCSATGASVGTHSAKGNPAANKTGEKTTGYCYIAVAA